MKKQITFCIVILFVCCLFTGCSNEEDSISTYFQEFTNEDISYEDGKSFVNSQVLLTAAKETSFKTIEKLVKKEKGKIVGYIPLSNDYQIEFSNKKNYEELIEVIDALKQKDGVEEVSLHYVSKTEENSIDYTKDPWINAKKPKDTSGSIWSESDPEGNNWWAEAIWMPSVWNMDLDFETVKVGVYDTMFDTDNEDLSDVFVKTWNNPMNDDGSCQVTHLYNTATDSEEKKVITHGSHVAGLIAASAENGFGIAGVSQNAELYGFAKASTPTDTKSISSWGSVFEVKYAIALMLNEGVRIINISNGFNTVKKAQEGDEGTRQVLADASDSVERFMLTCIDAGYDFLIVKSAGNEHGCDVKYDYMGAIENEDVKKHILIVGAAENQESYYSIAKLSNIGDRVDVYAPGIDILSDFPSNITGLKNGTSMSAPIVSGIASLIWGINPELKAEQVRDIIEISANIITTPNDKDSDNITSIVNAYYAVLMAQKTIGTGPDYNMENGTLMGFVYYNQNDNGQEYGLKDAAVNIIDENGVNTQVTTSTYGDFCAFLKPGSYTVTVEYEGYKGISQEIIVEAGAIYSIPFYMEEDLEEKIINAMNDAAIFAWSWFWDNEHYDPNDSLTEDGITFYRVNESNIKGKKDLETLTKRYFTDDVTKHLMTYKDWIGRNNSLYVSENEGLGGLFLSRISLQIEKESDAKYSLDVIEYGEFADGSSEILETYTVNYELIDGYWVFDKEFSWPDIISISIVEDNSKSQLSDEKSETEESPYKNGSYYYEGAGILGTWVSTDGQYVFKFTNDSFNWSIQNSGISAASGNFSLVDINNAEERVNGAYNQTGNTITVIANFNDSQIITFILTNGQLVAENLILNKIDNKIINKANGKWENGDTILEFESEEQFRLKNNHYSDWGWYYIVSENQILLGYKGKNFHLYDCKINGTVMEFDGNTLYQTQGAGDISVFEDQIVGQWMRTNGIHLLTLTKNNTFTEDLYSNGIFITNAYSGTYSITNANAHEFKIEGGYTETFIYNADTDTLVSKTNGFVFNRYEN